MGTSKGYIAPTTSHWSTAKRAVTAFINNRDFDSKAKAASKYATAMKTDMSTGGSFQSAAARTLGFAQKVASGGLDNALREYNREDLIGKPSEVVWTELLHEFTNSGASVEDNMAADALSQAMDNLEIEDIADIGNVSVDILLKEMLKEYIKENFDFRYEEKISKGKTPAQAYDFLIEYEESEKSADLRAVLGSIYRCKHSSDKELKRYIRCVGELTEEEVEKFLSLYKKSIEDLVQLFSADQRMKEYLGL